MGTGYAGVGKLSAKCGETQLAWIPGVAERVEDFLLDRNGMRMRVAQRRGVRKDGHPAELVFVELACRFSRNSLARRPPTRGALLFLAIGSMGGCRMSDVLYERIKIIECVDSNATLAQCVRHELAS
jgi:hypothetical protein